VFSWTNKHNTKKSETNSISWVRSQILQRTPESADVRAKIARLSSQFSDISIYICLIDIRDGSSKPVYGGVDCLMIGTDSYAYLWYTM